LPADGSRDSAITAALVNRPMTKVEAEVGYVVCAIDLIEDGLGVTAIIDLPPLGGTEIAVIETGDQIYGYRRRKLSGVEISCARVLICTTRSMQLLV
jgi:hypothetical protein